jgi:isoleucyl-tRNA synthetase
LPEGLQAQIREEVNVLKLDSLSETDELVDVSVKANFKALGARFGKETPNVANAITATDARQLVNALKSGNASVEVNGKSETVTLEDVVITEMPREGWTVSSEGGESLALDLALTPELLHQGIARDITRLIQDGRKSAGFEITDRIDVVWQSSNPDTQAALVAHGSTIATEVLATSWNEGAVSGGNVEDEELGFSAKLTKK